MAKAFNKQEIRDKILAGTKLTKAEELFYLVQVLKIPKEEAEFIIERAGKTTPTMIID